MPEVEAHADIVKVCAFDHFHQAVGGGKFVGDIFQQNAHAQRLGKRAQVFNRSHSRLELLVAETFIRRSQMLHQKAERNLLGNFESALDFIHRLDSRSAIDGCHIHRWRACAAPLVVREKWRVNRVEWNPAALEPLRNFLDVRLAVGIIDVLARRKNLDRLYPAASQPV